MQGPGEHRLHRGGAGGVEVGEEEHLLNRGGVGGVEGGEALGDRGHHRGHGARDLGRREEPPGGEVE